MWGFITAILLIVVGLLGAADLIVARRPDAQAALAKLTPYQGWLGSGAAFWGAWTLINFLWHLGDLSSAPLFWLSYLAAGLLALGLGLVLGVAVFKSFVTHKETVAKLDDVIARLSPYRGPGGLAAIGIGLWLIVATIIWA
jgi:hypothetical protein